MLRTTNRPESALTRSRRKQGFEAFARRWPMLRTKNRPAPALTRSSGKQKPFNQAFSSWSGALSVFLSYSAREDA